MLSGSVSFCLLHFFLCLSLLDYFVLRAVFQSLALIEHVVLDLKVKVASRYFPPWKSTDSNFEREVKYAFLINIFISKIA